MKTVEFHSTFGDYLTNPDPQKVKDLIFNHTLEEWAGGSGDSIVSYEDGSRSSSLTMIVHQDFGFGILYMAVGEKDSMLTEGERTGEVVHLVLADAYVYRDQLVSKETAWKAVEYFMQTGKCNPNLNWQAYEVPEVA